MFLLKDNTDRFYLIDIDKKIGHVKWYENKIDCFSEAMSPEGYNTWSSLVAQTNVYEKIEYLKKYYTIVAEITKEENPEYWF